MLVATATVCFASWIWRRSGDLVIDFGRELYVPWQLSQGRVLYRDLAYLYGPLSPYLNLCWWKLFGGGRGAVMTGNAIVLVATVAALYRVLLKLTGGDGYAATIASLFFLVNGAFGVDTGLTNYNFLTPYAHGMTHGLLLCLLVVLAVLRLHQNRRPLDAMWVGLTTGLAALTKPEICAAAVVAAMVGMLAVLISEASSNRRWRFIAMSVAAALIPPLGALLLLWTAMPFKTAYEGVLGGWQHIGKPYVIHTPFYRDGLGIDFTRRSVEKLFRYSCLYCQFALGLGLVGLAMRRRPKLSVAAGVVAGIGLFILGQKYPYSVPFWTM